MMISPADRRRCKGEAAVGLKRTTALQRYDDAVSKTCILDVLLIFRFIFTNVAFILFLLIAVTSPPLRITFNNDEELLIARTRSRFVSCPRLVTMAFATAANASTASRELHLPTKTASSGGFVDVSSRATQSNITRSIGDDGYFSTSSSSRSVRRNSSLSLSFTVDNQQVTPSVSQTVLIKTPTTYTRDLIKTETREATRTPTASNSFILTRSVTPAPTKTHEPTFTPTFSQTVVPPFSETVVDTVTYTFSNTLIPTDTRTKESTFTDTFSNTLIPTDSKTVEPTSTETDSSTLRPTFTKTFAHTATPTATVTPSKTLSGGSMSYSFSESMSATETIGRCKRVICRMISINRKPFAPHSPSEADARQVSNNTFYINEQEEWDVEDGDVLVHHHYCHRALSFEDWSLPGRTFGLETLQKVVMDVVFPCGVGSFLEGRIDSHLFKMEAAFPDEFSETLWVDPIPPPSPPSQGSATTAPPTKPTDANNEKASSGETQTSPTSMNTIERGGGGRESAGNTRRKVMQTTVRSINVGNENLTMAPSTAWTTNEVTKGTGENETNTTTNPKNVTSYPYYDANTSNHEPSPNTTAPDDEATLLPSVSIEPSSSSSSDASTYSQNATTVVTEERITETDGGGNETASQSNVSTSTNASTAITTDAFSTPTTAAESTTRVTIDPTTASTSTGSTTATPHSSTTTGAHTLIPTTTRTTTTTPLPTKDPAEEERERQRERERQAWAAYAAELQRYREESLGRNPYTLCGSSFASLFWAEMALRHGQRVPRRSALSTRQRNGDRNNSSSCSSGGSSSGNGNPHVTNTDNKSSTGYALFRTPDGNKIQYYVPNSSSVLAGPESPLYYSKFSPKKQIVAMSDASVLPPLQLPPAIVSSTFRLFNLPTAYVSFPYLINISVKYRCKLNNKEHIVTLLVELKGPSNEAPVLSSSLAPSPLTALLLRSAFAPQWATVINRTKKDYSPSDEDIGGEGNQTTESASVVLAAAVPSSETHPMRGITSRSDDDEKLVEAGAAARSGLLYVVQNDDGGDIAMGAREKGEGVSASIDLETRPSLRLLGSDLGSTASALSASIAVVEAVAGFITWLSSVVFLQTPSLYATLGMLFANLRMSQCSLTYPSKLTSAYRPDSMATCRAYLASEEGSLMLDRKASEEAYAQNLGLKITSPTSYSSSSTQASDSDAVAWLAVLEPLSEPRSHTDLPPLSVGHYPQSTSSASASGVSTGTSIVSYEQQYQSCFPWLIHSFHFPVGVEKELVQMREATAAVADFVSVVRTVKELVREGGAGWSVEKDGALRDGLCFYNTDEEDDRMGCNVGVGGRPTAHLLISETLRATVHSGVDLESLTASSNEITARVVGERFEHLFLRATVVWNAIVVPLVLAAVIRFVLGPAVYLFIGMEAEARDLWLEWQRRKLVSSQKHRHHRRQHHHRRSRGKQPSSTERAKKITKKEDPCDDGVVMLDDESANTNITKTLNKCNVKDGNTTKTNKSSSYRRVIYEPTIDEQIVLQPPIPQYRDALALLRWPWIIVVPFVATAHATTIAVVRLFVSLQSADALFLSSRALVRRWWDVMIGGATRSPASPNAPLSSPSSGKDEEGFWAGAMNPAFVDCIGLVSGAAPTIEAFYNSMVSSLIFDDVLGIVQSNYVVNSGSPVVRTTTTTRVFSDVTIINATKSEYLTSELPTNNAKGDFTSIHNNSGIVVFEKALELVSNLLSSRTVENLFAAVSPSDAVLQHNRSTRAWELDRAFAFVGAIIVLGVIVFQLVALLRGGVPRCVDVVRVGSHVGSQSTDSISKKSSASPTHFVPPQTKGGHTEEGTLQLGTTPIPREVSQFILNQTVFNFEVRQQHSPKEARAVTRGGAQQEKRTTNITATSHGFEKRGLNGQPMPTCCTTCSFVRNGKSPSESSHDIEGDLRFSRHEVWSAIVRVCTAIDNHHDEAHENGSDTVQVVDEGPNNFGTLWRVGGSGSGTVCSGGKTSALEASAPLASVEWGGSGEEKKVPSQLRGNCGNEAAAVTTVTLERPIEKPRELRYNLRDCNITDLLHEDNNKPHFRGEERYGDEKKGASPLLSPTSSTSAITAISRAFTRFTTIPISQRTPDLDSIVFSVLRGRLSDYLLLIERDRAEKLRHEQWSEALRKQRQRQFRDKYATGDTDSDIAEEEMQAFEHSYYGDGLKGRGSEEQPFSSSLAWALQVLTDEDVAVIHREVHAKTWSVYYNDICKPEGLHHGHRWQWSLFVVNVGSVAMAIVENIPTTSADGCTGKSLAGLIVFFLTFLLSGVTVSIPLELTVSVVVGLCGVGVAVVGTLYGSRAAIFASGNASSGSLFGSPELFVVMLALTHVAAVVAAIGSLVGIALFVYRHVAYFLKVRLILRILRDDRSANSGRRNTLEGNSKVAVAVHGDGHHRDDNIVNYNRDAGNKMGGNLGQKGTKRKTFAEMIKSTFFSRATNGSGRDEQGYDDESSRQAPEQKSSSRHLSVPLLVDTAGHENEVGTRESNRNSTNGGRSFLEDFDLLELEPMESPLGKKGGRGGSRAATRDTCVGAELTSFTSLSTAFDKTERQTLSGGGGRGAEKREKGRATVSSRFNSSANDDLDLLTDGDASHPLSSEEDPAYEHNVRLLRLLDDQEAQHFSLPIHPHGEFPLVEHEVMARSRKDASLVTALRLRRVKRADPNFIVSVADVIDLPEETAATSGHWHRREHQHIARRHAEGKGREGFVEAGYLQEAEDDEALVVDEEDALLFGHLAAKKRALVFGGSPTPKGPSRSHITLQMELAAQKHSIRTKKNARRRELCEKRQRRGLTKKDSKSSCSSSEISSLLSDSSSNLSFLSHDSYTSSSYTSSSGADRDGAFAARFSAALRIYRKRRRGGLSTCRNNDNYDKQRHHETDASVDYWGEHRNSAKISKYYTRLAALPTQDEDPDFYILPLSTEDEEEVEGGEDGNENRPKDPLDLLLNPPSRSERRLIRQRKEARQKKKAEEHQRNEEQRPCEDDKGKPTSASTQLTEDPETKDNQSTPTRAVSSFVGGGGGGGEAASDLSRGHESQTKEERLASKRQRRKKELMREINEWRGQFLTVNGRKAEKADLESAPEVQAKYKEWKALDETEKDHNGQAGEQARIISDPQVVSDPSHQANDVGSVVAVINDTHSAQKASPELSIQVASKNVLSDLPVENELRLKTVRQRLARRRAVLVAADPSLRTSSPAQLSAQDEEVSVLMKESTRLQRILNPKYDESQR